MAIDPEREEILQPLTDFKLPNIEDIPDEFFAFQAFAEFLFLGSPWDYMGEVSEKIELATQLMGDYILASLEVRIGTLTPEP